MTRIETGKCLLFCSLGLFGVSSVGDVEARSADRAVEACLDVVRRGGVEGAAQTDVDALLGTSGRSDLVGPEVWTCTFTGAGGGSGARRLPVAGRNRPQGAQVHHAGQRVRRRAVGAERLCASASLRPVARLEADERRLALHDGLALRQEGAKGLDGVRCEPRAGRGRDSAQRRADVPLWRGVRRGRAVRRPREADGGARRRGGLRVEYSVSEKERK